jgi:rfaE bifunctional protein kinase chain/domain
MYNLNNLNTNSIYVIGDIMIDHYIYGTCDRISPEAPVQIVDMQQEEYTLGGAGNVIKNLVSFGVNTGIVSVCGEDEGLEIINNSLKNLNVSNYKMIVDKSRKTTIKTRVVSNKHQLLRIDRENKHYIDDVIAGEIIAELKTKISNIKILIISDYSKGVLSEKVISAIIEICNENGVKTIVDSKDPLLSKYINATIIKPNKKEASIATGIKIVDDKTLTEACEKIAKMTQCEAVIITLSEEGMAVFHEGKLDKIPTKALDIFDVTGAGDTVVAALSFALLNNLSLIEACNFANHAAAVVVAKAGSATATLKEINHFIML